jgi:hypothetical protein
MVFAMSEGVLDIDGPKSPVTTTPTHRVPARLRTPALFMTQEDVRVALGSAVVWMEATLPPPWTAKPAEEEEEETTHVGEDDDEPGIHRAPRVEPEDDNEADADEGDIDASGKGGYADIGGWIETTYELDDHDIVEIWDDPEPSTLF